MNKNKKILLQNLMSLTIVTEIIGFIGLMIYKIASDINLPKTKEAGCITWALALIFALFSFTFLMVDYYKEKKENKKVQKHDPNNSNNSTSTN